MSVLHDRMLIWICCYWKHEMGRRARKDCSQLANKRLTCAMIHDVSETDDRVELKLVLTVA